MPAIYGDTTTQDLNAINGVAKSSTASGVLGGNQGTGPGVSGISSSGTGVSGIAASSSATIPAGAYGVYGSVTGTPPTDTGTYGVFGYGGTGDYAVYGLSGGVVSIYGNASGTGGTGVKGTGYGYGVQGQSSSGYGVYGSGYTYGVYGSGGEDQGVYGISTLVAGVRGDSNNSGYAGVIGKGLATGAYGVEGTCTGNGCYAGYFIGDVYISGTYGPSDIRFKKNVTPVSEAVAQLLKLHGVTFEWKEPRG